MVQNVTVTQCLTSCFSLSLSTVDVTTSAKKIFNAKKIPEKKNSSFKQTAEKFENLNCLLMMLNMFFHKYFLNVP